MHGTAPELSTLTNTVAAPGTVRAMTGAQITGVSLTSGNLVGSRGSVTITNSTNVGSGVYLYGSQGKLISGTGTIDAGSGHIAGVYGQLDLTGGTITSGHIAAVIGDIFAVGSNGANVDNFYAEQTTGTANNSAFKAIVNSTYMFDLASAAGATNCSLTGTPGAVTGTTGWIKVNLNGTTRYIPLASSVS